MDLTASIKNLSKDGRKAVVETLLIEELEAAKEAAGVISFAFESEVAINSITTSSGEAREIFMKEVHRILRDAVEEDIIWGGKIVQKLPSGFSCVATQEICELVFQLAENITPVYWGGYIKRIIESNFSSAILIAEERMRVCNIEVDYETAMLLGEAVKKLAD